MFSSLLLAFIIFTLSACGGSDSGGSSSSSGGGTSGSGANGGTYFTRTDTPGTAVTLSGSASQFCSWSDCPSGPTCGIKVKGTDYGTYVDWNIPNGNGTYTTDRFYVTPTNSGFQFTYNNSRVGDYASVSSWAAATQGDTGGYCSGTTSGGGGGAGGSTGTTGQVSVWTSHSTGGYISVSLDGSSAGTLTSYFTSTPTCGASGTITKTLSVGSHSLSASNSSATWGPSSFSITAGSCLLFRLN